MAALRIIHSLVLDASALGAASDKNSPLRFQLRKAAARGTRIYTTSATLTEVLRVSSRDVNINRLLTSINVQVIDGSVGRAAGLRVGRTSIRGNVTIDALVVEVASRLPKPVAIVTSDFKDLSALSDPDMMILDLSI